MYCFKGRITKKSSSREASYYVNPETATRAIHCCCCKGHCTNIANGNAIGTRNGCDKSTQSTIPKKNTDSTKTRSSSIGVWSVSTEEDGNICSRTMDVLGVTPNNQSASQRDTRNFGDRNGNRDAGSHSTYGDGETGNAYMPVSRNNPKYNMDHQRRGNAVIFNFEKWDNTMIPELKLKPRIGSEKDKADLALTLNKLEFNVETHDDCDSIEFWKILYQIRDEVDHSSSDCLFVCIMTHGEKNTIFMKDGTQIPVNLVWEHFEANKCPTLAGKPKIFIIQACRGKSYDSGTRLLNLSRQVAPEQQQNDEIDSGNFSYTIPNSADFFVAFSCPLGHYSWRNPQNGSWFIQSICAQLNKHAYDMDLESVFTEVARDVALNYESKTTEYESDKKKQVPSRLSTLIRKVYFKPKSFQSIRNSTEVTTVHQHALIHVDNDDNNGNVTSQTTEPSTVVQN